MIAAICAGKMLCVNVHLAASGGAVDSRIQSLVDELLLEQGGYDPVVLMMAAGWLAYSDYEAWRGARSRYLEDALRDAPPRLAEMFAEVAAYLRTLGLHAQAYEYFAWEGTDRAALRCARDPELDELMRSRYVRLETTAQLDLFMDAGATALANSVTRSLARRDTGEASRALERLCQLDPGHPRLAALRQLVDVALGLDAPVADPAAELERLEHLVLPLADDLLKVDARDFVAPFWRRLGSALIGQPLDPGRPELHASLVAERLGDWQAVVDAVTAEPGWRSQPVLLRREALAQGRLGRPWQSLSSWVLLCWRFPDQAEAMGREAAPEWRGRWRELADQEPELPPESFPAWLLLRYPGLTERLDPEVLGAAPPVFFLLRELLGGPPAPEAMELRRRLKQMDPDLFAHYLGSLGG